jgi:ATP-dependent Zn protease
MKQINAKLVRTAYHEAGHAVAHVVLELPPTSATIVADGDTRGRVRSLNPIYSYEGTGRRERSSRARNAIVAAYAGLAAEHVFCGTVFSFKEGTKHGAWRDHDEAWGLLCDHVPVRGSIYLGDDAYDAALQRLQRRALTLVHQNRAAIERVAHLLIKRHTLTGRQICAAVRGKGA